MHLDDFTARIGGTIKRRYKNGDWQDVEVRSAEYAQYYYDLIDYGYEFRF